MRVLILGGTAEARDLARRLVESGAQVMSSLAGRVPNPRLPVGPVRIGGFGGVEGLAAEAAAYDAVVDATHPFAATITRNAYSACDRADLPLLRLERAGWAERSLSSWHWVDGHPEAASAARDLGGRPVLTIGRQSLAQFVPDLHDRAVLARVVDDRALDLPESWTVVTDRGPYLLADERRLLRSHAADVLVTKDSGGEYTWPKMLAAAELNIPVVIVRRPPLPDGMACVGDVGEVLAWLEELSPSGE